MELSSEQLIADLEMMATAISQQAEQISRLASRSAEDTQRLELWSIAMNLEDQSKAARKQACGLWSATGRVVNAG